MQRSAFLLSLAGMPTFLRAVPDPPVVLLVGGLDGDATSTRIVQRESSSPPRGLRVLTIPRVNASNAPLVFPPVGLAYKDNAESHALWRAIGLQAPDLVLIAGTQDFGLAAALANNSVAGMGRIPARLDAAKAGLIKGLPRSIPKSEARLELERRLARTPRQAAEELAPWYGHEFKEAVYISAVALLAQLRLGRSAEVERFVEPYLDGTKRSLAKPTGSHLAGHLLFGELAKRTRDARCVELVCRAADLGFLPDGTPRESMPLHDEMSDAVFMGCPIAAQAGRLTGNPKYFDMALRHLRFIQKLCLRPDGLYRHSPLTDAAWGRGNAFPALGLALALSDLPKTHPAFDPMLLAFQQHISALVPYQTADGLWRQVIDNSASYSEFSATAMTATAMLRGIRNGWLDRAAYQACVDKAWHAVNARIAADGRLIDVCEGTGKQASLDAYLRRVAIFGRDPRGGAMALLFATELDAPAC